MLRQFLAIALLVSITSFISAQDKKEARVTWDDNVAAILKQRCVTCHNVNKKSSGLDLSTYTNIMLGGASGDVIELGSAADSYLYMLITHESEPFMPPNADPIPSPEIETIKKWIDTGAPENSGSKVMVPEKPKFEFTVSDNPSGKPSTPPMPGRIDKQPNVYSPKTAAVSAIATNPWSSLIAIAGQKKITLYDSNTLQIQGVLPYPEGIAYVLKFSRNGSLLLAGGGTASSTGKVIVFNIANGERVFEIGDELDAVMGADISADQSLIALGGPSKLIRIFSTADGSQLFEIKKHTEWITRMEFSPDGVLLATGDRNGGLHVWEAFTGREYLTLKGHTKRITGISWRADSNILASSSEDGSVRLWEMENGGQVKTWGAHGGGVSSLEFARDGRLVTCGRDRLTKVWDQAGAQQRAFPAFSDIAMECSFCDETNRVIAGDWTGKINVWKADDGALIGELASNPQPLETRLTTSITELTAAQTKHKPLADNAVKTKANIDLIKKNLAANMVKMETAKKTLATAEEQITTYDKSSKSLDANHKLLTALAAKTAPVIPGLTESVAKANAAAATNTDDKELAALTAQLQTVLTKRINDLKTTQTTAATTKIELTKAQEQLAAAQKLKVDSTTNMVNAKKDMDTIAATVKPAEEATAAAAKLAAEAQAIVVASQQQVDHWKSEIAFSKQLGTLHTNLDAAYETLATQHQTHAELGTKTNEAQATYNAANAIVTTATSTVTNTTKRVADTTATQATALKTQQTIEKSHTDAVTNATNLKAAVAALGIAVTKANEAVTSTGGDKELKAAADVLKTLTDKKTAEVPVAEKLIVTRKTELTATQQAYVVSQKAVIDAQTALAAAKKVQAEAIAARKPTEDALAKVKVELAAAAKIVADTTNGVDQIHQQVVALQTVK
jgi:WD40 repeat protein